MKNLTKMIAMVAAMSSMHVAKADGVEKEFVPGGEIEQISIVNGQLEVRSTGAEIKGVKTPYVYVGTNTDHFAENAFARGGLENVDRYVHVGAGRIYMTEKDNNTDIWTTEIKAAPAALNGVTAVTKVGDDNTTGASAMTEETATMLALIKENVKGANLFKVVDDELYCATDSNVYKYSKSKEKWVSKNKLTVDGKIKDFAIVPNGGEEVICYTLVEEADKNTVYRNSTYITDADSIALNGDKVVVTSGSTINTYDKSGKLTSSVEMSGDANTPRKIKSSVIAGDIMYYATANTIGYERMN